MRTLLAVFIASGFIGACRREPTVQAPQQPGVQIGQSTAPLPAEPVEPPPGVGSGSNEDHIPFNRPPDDTTFPQSTPIPGDAGVPQSSGDAGPPPPPLPPPPSDGGVPDDAQPGAFSPPGNP